MRRGGRFVSDGKGGEPKRVDKTIGNGEAAKPNPAHSDYPAAKPPAQGGEKTKGK